MKRVDVGRAPRRVPRVAGAVGLRCVLLVLMLAGAAVGSSGCSGGGGAPDGALADTGSGSDGASGAGAGAEVEGDVVVEITSTDAELDLGPVGGSEGDADAAAAGDEGDEATPPSCPEAPAPGPWPGEAIDSCVAAPSEVLQISSSTGFDEVAVEMQGSQDFGVAAARYGEGGEVRFWRVSAMAVATEDVWPAAVDAGPWVVNIGDDSYAVIWGEGDAVRFARPGGEPVTTSTGAAPGGAFARQGGTRVLVRGPMAWELIGTDEDGTWEDGHLVANGAKVDRIWLEVDGDLVVIPFTAPGEEQELSYLTGDVQGGQCSLPAPYYLSVGAEAELLDIGAAYGLTAFAWRTTPPVGCPVHSRIHVRLFGLDGVEFDSAVPFGDRVRWTASASVGTAVTLVAESEGWRAAGQAVDLAAKEPGQVVEGPVVGAASVPLIWEIARDRGHHVLAWEGEGGVAVQRFCF